MACSYIIREINEDPKNLTINEKYIIEEKRYLKKLRNRDELKEINTNALSFNLISFYITN